MALMTINNQSLPTNLTIQVVSNSKELWYDSTLIATLLGVVVGAVLTVLFSRLRERTELKRYEYNLLSTTVDLLSKPLNTEIEKEIKDFVDKTYPDLRFTQIKSGHLMRDALLKAKKGEDYSEEMKKITTQIKNIRNSVRR